MAQDQEPGLLGQGSARLSVIMLPCTPRTVPLPLPPSSTVKHLAMPDYRWTCQVCSGSNLPGADVCTTCRSPAQLSAVEIDRLQRSLFPDRAGESLHGSIYRFLSEPSGWMPLSYALVTAVMMLQAAACGGDMCGLSGILPAILLLPWSLLSLLATFVSAALANAILVLALVANTYWIRAIGKRLAQRKRVSRIPPSA